ncbi:hypothetical protein EI94DRAFT_1745484 [Lactarius quietus]|nr:hypothetical protein EI94DRAFT_1745484 [Lactarius quietus]
MEPSRSRWWLRVPFFWEVGGASISFAISPFAGSSLLQVSSKNPESYALRHMRASRCLLNDDVGNALSLPQLASSGRTVHSVPLHTARHTETITEPYECHLYGSLNFYSFLDMRPWV